MPGRRIAAVAGAAAPLLPEPPPCWSAVPSSRDRRPPIPQLTVTSEETDGTPTLQVSYDDGKSWTNAPLRANGSAWTAQVRNPASGYVSLRGIVEGVVDQTVIRAYGVR